MLEIYHSPGTRGLRVIQACEEINLAYKVIAVEFKGDYRASPEWRRMNPVGKVPVMCDGDLTMYESGAMMQYVLDNYGDGQLQPPLQTPMHAMYLQWCWFAESTFARPLGEITNHRRAFAPPIEAVMQEMRDRATLCVQALEPQLQGLRHLLGDDFSGADIMISYSLRAFSRHVPDYDLPSNVAQYLARLDERPAYKATLQAQTPN